MYSFHFHSRNDRSQCTVSTKRKYTLAAKPSTSTQNQGGLGLVHPLLFIWPPSVLSTHLDKSVYFLLGWDCRVTLWCFSFPNEMKGCMSQIINSSFQKLENYLRNIPILPINILTFAHKTWRPLLRLQCFWSTRAIFQCIRLKAVVVLSEILIWTPTTTRQNPHKPWKAPPPLTGGA